MNDTGTTKRRWAVIGGGNGGQSAAGHLGILGFPVTLYDIMQDTVDAIKYQGGVAGSACDDQFIDFVHHLLRRFEFGAGWGQ